MKTKHEKFVMEAIGQALKSTFSQRLGAIVISNNRVVGRGFNYAHGTGRPFGDGEHAEVAALNNTTAKHRRDSSIYVVRLGRSGAIRNSRPCDSCIKIMRKMGVRYAWHADNDGMWHRITL